MPRPRDPVNEEAVRERHAVGVGVKAIMKQFGIGAARVREICGIEQTKPAPVEAWTVEIEIPSLKLMGLIQRMDGDEAIAFLLACPPKTQADAIAFSFQRRMDAVPTDSQFKEVEPNGQEA